jgi:PRTRC genetic system protein C
VAAAQKPRFIGLLRFFGIKLPDPNPELTVEKVREIHAMTYPEISTAAVEGPEPVGNRLRYTFSRAVATKG